MIASEENGCVSDCGSVGVLGVAEGGAGMGDWEITVVNGVELNEYGLLIITWLSKPIGV